MKKLSLIILVASLLAACAPAATPAPTAMPAAPAVGVPVSVEGSGTYTNLTPAELAGMLKHKDFLFVNTHIPYDGELEQTDAFIEFEESGSQRVSEYPADKNAKIVLYCRSGRMSAIVAQELVKAGYTNVWNLDGGFRAWEAAGYPVLHKK